MGWEGLDQGVAGSFCGSRQVSFGSRGGRKDENWLWLPPAKPCPSSASRQEFMSQSTAGDRSRQAESRAGHTVGQEGAWLQPRSALVSLPPCIMLKSLLCIQTQVFLPYHRQPRRTCGVLILFQPPCPWPPTGHLRLKPTLISIMPTILTLSPWSGSSSHECSCTDIL